MRERYETTHDAGTLNEQYAMISAKHPNMMFLILNLDDEILPEREQRSIRYVVQPEKTLADVYTGLRKRIKLHSAQAIFVFWNQRLENISRTVGEIYQEHKHASGFLFGDVYLEKAFG